MKNNEKNELLNIYEIRHKAKINKSKVLIVIISVLIIILLIIILMYTMDTIKKYNIYQQYKSQLITMQEKEKEKQEEIAKELERKRQEKIPKLTEEGKENIQKIYSSQTKRAFLTFDDGPSSQTEKILDILKQYNIKATFFVLGSRVEAMPQVVSRIYEEGHFIANHGYSHVYEQIYTSPQTVLDEFNSCNDAVKKAINEPEYNSHLFRFPGGLAGGKYEEIKKQARDLLISNNIVNVDWNCLIGDAEKSNATSEFLMQRLQETSQNKNSIVVLMHDAQAKTITTETLPQIIEYLQQQGYEFKSFYDIIK